MRKIFDKAGGGFSGCINTLFTRSEEWSASRLVLTMGSVIHSGLGDGGGGVSGN